ncbi:hypothetical protein L596_002146 [Steinernema carpocapsae]|uniref:Uncharacterized protein n=1 Tax=Steinernema carpocapsae TaxID=34508 RepID=A0A4U8UNQ4_STECR|nr:hypothetical protein L596_002146 [Steinernema carpocapsae]
MKRNTKTHLAHLFCGINYGDIKFSSEIPDSFASWFDWSRSRKMYFFHFALLVPLFGDHGFQTFFVLKADQNQLPKWVFQAFKGSTTHLIDLIDSRVGIALILQLLDHPLRLADELLRLLIFQ